MAKSRTPSSPARRIFRALAVAALISAFAQVTLGGIVRVTGSGLGCPDWPLCHGRLIPPFEFATLLEYSHRLSASLLGLLVLATAVIVLLRYRRNKWGTYAILTALALVIVAAALGGATVLTELAWWLRLLHLGIAEGAVAALVVAVVVSWRIGQSAPQKASQNENTRIDKLTIAALVSVFLLILSGSYIVGAGYGSSCATWPLCNGSLFPEGRPYIEHMAHRYFAALVGVLIAVAAFSAWRKRLHMPSVGWSGLLLALVFIAQILVGALTVWLGFTAEIKAIHLSMATLVWIALMFMAALSYAPQRFDDAPIAPERSETAKMEGLAT